MSMGLFILWAFLSYMLGCKKIKFPFELADIFPQNWKSFMFKNNDGFSLFLMIAKNPT